MADRVMTHVWRGLSSSISKQDPGWICHIDTLPAIPRQEFMKPQKLGKDFEVNFFANDRCLQLINERIGEENRA